MFRTQGRFVHFFSLFLAYLLIFQSFQLAQAMPCAKKPVDKKFSSHQLNLQIAQTIDQFIVQKKAPQVSAFLVKEPGAKNLPILERKSVLIVGAKRPQSEGYYRELTLSAAPELGIPEDLKIEIVTSSDHVRLILPNRLLLGLPEHPTWKDISNTPRAFKPTEIQSRLQQKGLDFAMRAWDNHVAKLEYQLLSGKERWRYFANLRGGWDLKASFLAFVMTPLVMWVVNMVGQGALTDSVKFGVLVSNFLAMAYFCWNAVFLKLKAPAEAKVDQFVARGDVPYRATMWNAFTYGLKQNYFWSLKGMGLIGAMSLVSGDLSSPVFMISAFIAVFVSLVNIPLVITKERIIPLITRWANRGLGITSNTRLRRIENAVEYVPQVALDVFTQTFFPIAIGFGFANGLLWSDGFLVHQFLQELLGVSLTEIQINTGFAMLGCAMLAYPLVRMVKRMRSVPE